LPHGPHEMPGRSVRGRDNASVYGSGRATQSRASQRNKSGLTRLRPMESSQWSGRVTASHQAPPPAGARPEWPGHDGSAAAADAAAPADSTPSAPTWKRSVTLWPAPLPSSAPGARRHPSLAAGGQAERKGWGGVQRDTGTPRPPRQPQAPTTNEVTWDVAGKVRPWSRTGSRYVATCVMPRTTAPPFAGGAVEANPTRPSSQ